MSPAVVLTAQVTLLLLLALALAWLGRRGSPRTIHQLWTATFALVLALPLLGILAPSWNVPILPARGDEPRPSAAEAPAAAGAAAETAVEAAATPRVIPKARGSDIRNPGAVPAARAGQPSGASWSPLRVLLIVWALGCAISLISLAAGAMRLRALVRAALPLHDPALRRQADAIRRRMRIRADVQLLSSDLAATPMTGGLWKPVILLPAAAVDWSPERRAVVLTHELIHVRRRDVLRQLMRRIVLALYWFHPLGWLAARRAEVASEKACDEEVLALGARPSDYARLLLRLASARGRRPNLLALPLVRTSQLETRIVAILKCSRPRPSVTRTVVTLTIVGSAAVSVAAAHPVPFDEVPVPSHEAGPAREDAPPAASDAPPAAIPAPRDGELAVSAAVGPQAGGAMRQEIQCPWAGSDSIRTMRVRGGLRVTGWNDGDRTIERLVAGMYLCMRTHGDVVMSDDGTEVRAVGTDSWLLLESREDQIRRLVITEGLGGIEYAWSVDDVSRTFDAEARQWHDLMLRIMNGYQEVMEIRGEESTLRGRISAHRGHVSSLRGQISAHRGHVSSLRGRMSAHSGQASTLRGRISAHRGHVSGLRGRISVYRGRISSLNAAMRLAARAETRAALEDELQELESRMRQTEEEVAAYDLDGKVREVEQQIAAHAAERRIREVEQQMEDYDLSGKVAAIRAEIEAYDLEGKRREIERLIEELDTDRRIEEIEDSLEDEIAALRRLAGSTG
ncbi:M56 family metallopeptidase [Candidatus Palauibacter sp.]|uniref:M56 family metallopeptidase n=1 Tax=Candidatus Palauibacter sp. TaxID=3101350 RepID=UPI003B515B31